jgi:hypothetical protein
MRIEKYLQKLDSAAISYSVARQIYIYAQNMCGEGVGYTISREYRKSYHLQTFLVVREY